MKLNLKSTILASSLILLTLSACTGYQIHTPTIKTNNIAKTVMPPIPVNKTTGHREQIINAMSLASTIPLELFSPKNITFDENSFNEKTNTFDISNLKAHSMMGVNINIDRIVRSSKKLSQISNINLTNGDYSEGHITIKKIILISNSKDSENIDINLYAQGIKAFGNSSNNPDTTIDDINLIAKINNTDVKKFYFAINQAKNSVSSNYKLKPIDTIKYSLYFYKGVNNNLYNIVADSKVHFTDSSNKPNMSAVKSKISLKITPETISYIILSLKYAIANKGNLIYTIINIAENLYPRAPIGISATLNTQNNGIVNAIKNAQPDLKDKIERTNKKDAKKEMKLLSGAFSQSELSHLVDVAYNFLLNNNNLKIKLTTLKSMSIKELIYRAKYSPEKIIKIESSN